MTRLQRNLTIALWCLLAVAAGSIIAPVVLGRRQGNPVEQGDPLSRRAAAPAFSLTDQNGQSFTNKDLLGHVWIANFVFTRCAGPCPMMTQKMLEIQKLVPDASVKLVTFTVDPEHDTPEVLKAYAAEKGADPSRWRFGTGRMADLYSLAEGMQVAAKPAEGENPIIHYTGFILVDAGGFIRGHYSSQDPQRFQQLSIDATALVKESRP